MGTAFAQTEPFRGIVRTTEYAEFPSEQRERQAAVLADVLGTSRENWDTLYATNYVCSDTIVQTYHGLDPSVSHMMFEYGRYSFFKFVDPERGVEFARVGRSVNDLSGATANDWKRVRDKARDSAYQAYDYRMVHPERQFDTYYASVDESARFDRQLAFGGYFAALFNPHGRYRKTVSLTRFGRRYTDYTYEPLPELDCGALLQGVQLRPRDKELEEFVAYRPSSELIPTAERQPFDPIGLLDSNAYQPVDPSVHRGQYLLVDLWATWCLPCRQEMSFLADLQERYHDKPFQVVSISLDGTLEQANWREARAALKMDWINWIAEEAMESQLVQDYVVRGIPVYLLVDPAGRVMLKNAPRPSSVRLTELLDELLGYEEQ